MKFEFETVILILAISFALGLSISFHAGNKENVKRCMDLYLTGQIGLSILLDKDIEAAAKEKGFSGTEELVRDRCETFVKNGQKF